MTAAEPVGPLVAGALVRFLSAPVAVLVTATTYAVSAAVRCTIRAQEPAPQGHPDRHLWRGPPSGSAWARSACSPTG